MIQADPNGKVTVSIEHFPLTLRIARRGRSFEAAAKEAGVSSTTLRAAEAGVSNSLGTIQLLVNWTSVSVIIGPVHDLKDDDTDRVAEPDEEGAPSEPPATEGAGDG